MIRLPTGLLARLTLGLALALAAAAPAPAWANLASDCTGVCHDASNPKYLNGANASGIINYANTNGMGASFTAPATASTIAAEIAALLPTFNPANEAITFETGKTFNLPNIFHSTTWGGGATSAVSTVSAPNKGSVTYPAVGAGANYQATYTPDACATGTDSFTYRASGSGGNTSTRTASVVIGNPTTGPTILTGATLPGGTTGTPYNTSLSSTCQALVTYSHVGGTMPNGLSINGGGTISGTPTVPGAFNFTIRATYTGGQFSEKAFSITVNPSVTSAATAPNGSVGVVYAGYTITGSGTPSSYNATGLPPGLTVNTGNGQITGTPTDAAGSPYLATVSANYTSPAFTANRSVTFNIVPAINSPSTATGQTGVPFTYNITSAPGPAFTSCANLDPLPAGLTRSGCTISGTPTTVGGPTNVRLTGTTAFGGTSAQFTLAITINLGPPVITSSLAAAGGSTVAFNYQITATNPPHTAFGASPLPAGLNVDTTTGVISGAPAPGTGGVHNITISATNASGTGQATLVLTISENPPVITSPLAASGQTGSPFTYTIVATNGTTGFSTSPLPAGLTLNSTSGVISGTPTAVGVFNVTLTATNGSGSDNKVLVITITLGPPVITSAATAGGNEGFAFSYQITATNNPTSYGATGLPAGLSINTGTGLISGTPTVTGTFTVTISATNATATATQTLTITLGVGIPVITSAASASGGTGVPFNYQITATNGPTSYNATGLPPGLLANTTTGVISGTPTAAGTFNVNLSATNATGTGTRALPITIALRPPTVPIGGPVTGINGVPFSYTIPATNGATGFSATGLPPGLEIGATSGIITGTPTASGTFAATISVTNAAGTTTFTLTIVIQVALATAADTSAQVPFETATPITLPVVGEQYTVNIVVLPSHGLVSVAPGSNVATYAPATGYLGTDSFRFTVTNAAGTSAEAQVAINVVPVPPTGRTALFRVQLNTSAILDLAPLVKGSGVTGVSIQAAPSHGTATVNGMQVTYTPRIDYFGADAFRYVAYGDAGQSSPVTINIEVVGRPDPSRDPDVVGLVEAQNQAARRFAGAQIGNIQRRMESLHDTGAVEPSAAAALAPAAAAVRPERVRVAAATTTQPETARDVGPLSLVTTIAQAVTSRSVDLGGATGRIDRGTSVWIAGNAWFGNLDATGERAGSRFGTDGVSLGADRRFGERLAAGVAAGFAREDVKVGTSGTRTKARGASIAGYGSYRVGPRTFIDALLGYGSLRFDSDRHVTALDEFARSERKGRQVFGSIATAYEYRYGNLLASPYGRFDFSADRLDAVSESGVGNYALRYAEQSQRTGQAALGVRAESRHETDFGFAVPRARAEYRREFGGNRRAIVSYADLIGGEEYAITPAGTSRNSLLLGVGADLVFRGGLKLGLEYTAQRASGASNTQGVRLMVTQELDAPAATPWRFEPLLYRYPINVDFGYAFDDNVNRGRESREKRWDNVFSMSANASRAWPIATNARAQLTALASGEKFDRHAGLGRFSGGGQAELQYRTSGAFDATTLALVGRALYEQYESHYRTGPRYFLGFNARRALTDRIELFAELGANARHGNSEVFNWRDYAAKLNVDYALGRKGILYFTGEYRRGDTVSTGRASLVNVGVADVFVADDAFEGLDYFAYRFDARTVLGTIGLNYPLGGRDSVDLSWRRVESTPRKRPAWDFSGPLRYIDNQYSLVYLMRF